MSLSRFGLFRAGSMRVHVGMSISPRRKLFFFHNPKAGGSSVKRFLEGLVAPEVRCPIIENTQREHERVGGRYAPFRGYDFYGGHYGFDVYEAVNDGHAPVTNLRHPAARLLSLYNYCRLSVRVQDTPEHRDNFYSALLAQHMDFRSFILSTDPRVEVYTRNYHVRQLTSSAWSVDSSGDLRHAVALLDRMPWYYVCEHPQLSERWAHVVFGSQSGRVPRVNVTGDSVNDRTAVTEIGPATLRVIEEKNTLDIALHEYATRRLLGKAHAIRAHDAGAMSAAVPHRVVSPRKIDQALGRVAQP